MGGCGRLGMKMEPDNNAATECQGMNINQLKIQLDYFPGVNTREDLHFGLLSQDSDLGIHGDLESKAIVLFDLITSYQDSSVPR